MCGSQDLLGLPRPPSKFHVQTLGNLKHIEQQFGFPSTHSAHAVCQAYVLSTAAAKLGWLPASWLCFAVGGLHILHVCFSRLYLGVHSLADIVGGISVGALTALLAAAAGDEVDVLVTHTSIGQIIGVVAAITVLLTLYPDRRPSNTAYDETIAFAGLYAGACLAAGVDRFGAHVATGNVHPLGLFVVGLIALGLVREVLGLLSKQILARIDPAYKQSWLGLFRQYALCLCTAWFVAAVRPQWVLQQAGAVL
jgi:hypothetical protein